MLKAGVTIGCAAAMVVAAVLAVRWRHTRRTPSPLSGSEPRSSAARDYSEQPDVDRSGARPGRILVMALGVLGSLSIVVAAGQVLAL
jgi:hypothetical protein